MTDLVEKLKQFGLEEEISFHHFSECKDVYPVYRIEFFVFVSKSNRETLWVEMECENITILLKELKTDSDWQAVANFIKFLKGE